jgi:Xaa-Pro aminopeptidase
MDARAVKTPEEIAVCRANGALVMDMLGAFEAAIGPGVRERDLVAVLTDAMLRGGGEYLITRGVASGPNTNPWRQEATDRAIAAGDLVFVDTDVNGIEGYFSCVSRTFVAGDAGATPEQRDAYAIARQWVRGMHDLVRAGVGFRELAERAPALPERFRTQRYECVLHSCGLEDEGPSVSYADATQPNPDRVIEPGMVVVSEVYLGEVGAPFGVKLGDQWLVTEAGLEDLAPYPLDARLG